MSYYESLKYKIFDTHEEAHTFMENDGIEVQGCETGKEGVVVFYYGYPYYRSPKTSNSRYAGYILNEKGEWVLNFSEAYSSDDDYIWD